MGKLPFAILASAIMIALSATGGAGAVLLQTGPRFFQETGFSISNDRFLSHFNSRAGVGTFGLPVSRSFILEGFEVQLFQRAAMQLQPDGSVRLLNLLDEGLMPVSSINFSRFPDRDPLMIAATPSVEQPAYAARTVEFVRTNVPNEFNGLPVGFVATFERTVRSADSGSDLSVLLGLEFWGAPTSPPAFDRDNHNFVYQRFQRGVMRFDATAGRTEGLLLGDWFKSVLTGQGLPPDLEEQMAGSRFLRQYDNSRPRGISRPDELPLSDLTDGFEPEPLPTPFVPRVEVVATGLEVPWSLAFAPDGCLFFTERPGRVRVIVEGQLLPTPVAVLPAVTTMESGLMSLALDPDFQSNGHIYVMYTRRTTAGQLVNRVSRLTVDGNVARDEVVLLDGVPGASIHDGGRLKFGPDGRLYITTGDAAVPSLAQDLSSLAGKVLRLDPDGSVPGDNPFPGSRVFTFGHRNPQGLAFHPEIGILLSTEHGPVGNDEENVLGPGGNYGWPVVQGVAMAPRFVDPVAVFTPAVAPAGATFYSGSELFPWTGSLLVATLRGEHLHRMVLGRPGLRQVLKDERARATRRHLRHRPAPGAQGRETVRG